MAEDEGPTPTRDRRRQITLRELLKDSNYKKWFLTKPVHHSEFGAPVDGKWRVWAQEEAGGRWSRKNVTTYAAGVRLISKLLKRGWHDMSLTSGVWQSRPPVVSSGGKRRYLAIVPRGHEWCGYCRRPTRFIYFKQHHALPWAPLSKEPRCTVCGMRAAGVKQYPQAKKRGEE